MLDDDLMSGMIERLFLQPTEVAHGPSLLARFDAPMLEHGNTDLLAMHPQGLDGRSSGADQVAHGFMTFIRHPHRRELARQ